MVEYPPWFIPTFTWISRFSSIHSTVGSLAIIYIIISDRSRKLARPKNRLMLFMCIFDSIQSIAIAISTAGTLHPGICQIQGICIWLGVAVPLYNSSLNLFYILSTRYNMDPDCFSAQIEPYLHALSILYPITIAISYTPAGFIQPINGHICWSTGIPVFLGWGLPVMCSFIFCFFSMASIYQAVTRQINDNKKERPSLEITQTHHNSELEETRTQALLYILASFLTFIFPLAQGLMYGYTSDIVYSIFVICTMIFYPLQGFWNFIFYISPNVRHVRKKNPEKCLLRAVQEVVFDARAVADSLRKRSRPTRRLSGIMLSKSFVTEVDKGITKNEGMMHHL